MAAGVIVLTAGEPAGIGPDLCVQIAQLPWDNPLVVIADPELLRERAARLMLPLHLRPLEPGGPPPRPAEAGTIYVLTSPLAAASQAGCPDPANAEYVLATLRMAAEGCIDGRFEAMVTGPVHKAVINDAGIPFSGHTEFLAGLCAGEQPVMMLACQGLRVALATTHLPLRDVAAAITRPGLARTLRILHHDLRARFAIPHPRILVCGLNPHAGEGGHLGREEIDIIEPTLDDLRREGLVLEGPLPADTLFNEQRLQDADAVLAMYHDQGLPVLKYKGFGTAVNITLGLPIIRTSVDHGTALELAATGTADPGSMLAAIEQAIAIAGRRPAKAG